MLKKLQRLLLDSDKPNTAQLKLFSQTFADLAKATAIGSGALVFVPSDGTNNLLLSTFGFIAAVILLIISSRFLKEVKEP